MWCCRIALDSEARTQVCVSENTYRVLHASRYTSILCPETYTCIPINRSLFQTPSSADADHTNWYLNRRSSYTHQSTPRRIYPTLPRTRWSTPSSKTTQPVKPTISHPQTQHDSFKIACLILKDYLFSYQRRENQTDKDWKTGDVG